MKTEKEIQERIIAVKELLQNNPKLSVSLDIEYAKLRATKNALQWVLDSAQKENKTEDKNTEYRTDYYKY